MNHALQKQDRTQKAIGIGFIIYLYDYMNRQFQTSAIQRLVVHIHKVEKTD